MTFPSRRRIIERIGSVFGRAVRMISPASRASNVDTSDLPPDARANQERKRQRGFGRHRAAHKSISPEEYAAVHEALAEEDKELKDIEEGHHVKSKDS